ncbi:hypothetical protein QJQ45_003037 [Haematococcus lacustris]|nr:hypothetical protein QJQ45_003037 [Haematococcus lacustris]
MLEQQELQGQASLGVLLRVLSTERQVLLLVQAVAETQQQRLTARQGPGMANVSVADEIAAAKKKETQLEHDLATTSDAPERAAIRQQLAALTNLLATYQAGNALSLSVQAVAETQQQRLTARQGPGVGVSVCMVLDVCNAWKQQDSKAFLNVCKRVLMYANIIVINDREQPPVECRMRALVDTGASIDLLIPLRKAQQLKLVERSRGHLKGFEGGRVDMIHYAPVVVKLPSDDSSGQEQTFKRADLAIYAKDVPLVQEEDLSNFAGFRQSQTLSPDGNLQLTPVNSPPRGDIAPTILGIEGLRKLRVTVNPEEALLCPMEFGDEWLVV